MIKDNSKFKCAKEVFINDKICIILYQEPSVTDKNTYSVLELDTNIKSFLKRDLDFKEASRIFKILVDHAKEIIDGTKPIPV